jgi:PEP-CTERM motif
MVKAWAIILGVALVSLGGARADTFTINPLQSILTIAATFQGAAATPQPPAGFTASYTGTIDATPGPMSIQFNSAAAAASSAGTYSPAVGGGAGTALGNYGGNFTVGGIFPGSFAVRGLTASLTSSSISLTGGSFDASQLMFVITGGSVDYRVAALSLMGNIALSGSSANGAGTGTLSSIGGVQTLTIPIDVTLTFTVVNPNDATFHLTGNIVATAIPEPATYMLMGFGILVCAQQFRRRKG